jgi:phage terminase Nu1 subunit (DNA packaging protein)
MAIKAAEIEFSLGTWAAELGVSRDVLRRILTESGVVPVGKRSGHPLYRGREVITAWVSHLNGGDERDPDKLPPIERKAHYQAEHEKLQLQRERGELVPSLQVEQEIGALVKRFAQGLDALPDVLERDVGVHPVLVARIERAVDELREAIYQDMNADAEDDGADSAAEDSE